LSDRRLNAALEVEFDDEGNPLPKNKSKVTACASLMIASLAEWAGMQFDIELPKKNWNLGSKDRRKLRTLAGDILHQPLGKVRTCMWKDAKFNNAKSYVIIFLGEAEARHDRGYILFAQYGTAMIISCGYNRRLSIQGDTQLLILEEMIALIALSGTRAAESDKSVADDAKIEDRIANVGPGGSWSDARPQTDSTQTNLSSSSMKQQQQQEQQQPQQQQRISRRARNRRSKPPLPLPESEPVDELANRGVTRDAGLRKVNKVMNCDVMENVIDSISPATRGADPTDATDDTTGKYNFGAGML
jgi:hypothetical protein